MIGLIHLYSGDGKGKTTAALGLALRFAGHNGKAIIVQLSKGRDTGELHSLAHIPEIEVLRCSRDYGFWKSMSEAERAACRMENDVNLTKAVKAAESGACGLLIIDEATSAYENGAVDRAVIDKLLSDKPRELELVLTGRNPTKAMLSAADYISEIRSVRHPYERGVDAREGIEF